MQSNQPRRIAVMAAAMVFGLAIALPTFGQGPGPNDHGRDNQHQNQRHGPVQRTRQAAPRTQKAPGVQRAPISRPTQRQQTQRRPNVQSRRPTVTNHANTPRPNIQSQRRVNARPNVNRVNPHVNPSRPNIQSHRQVNTRPNVNHVNPHVNQSRPTTRTRPTQTPNLKRAQSHAHWDQVRQNRVNGVHNRTTTHAPISGRPTNRPASRVAPRINNVAPPQQRRTATPNVRNNFTRPNTFAGPTAFNRPRFVPQNFSQRREFTRSTAGFRFDNRIRLRPAVPVYATWQRPYFPLGHCYYPYYRPTFSAAIVISPFAFYFGVCDPFIAREHCYVRYPSYTYVEVPVYEGPRFVEYRPIATPNYYNDPGFPRREPGLMVAIDQLQEGVRDCDIDTMVGLTAPGVRIAIYNRGHYDYSMDPDDYLDLTRDAFVSTRTVDFEINTIHRRANGYYVVSGRHVYEDKHGNRRSVYLSYVMEDVNHHWVIAQVGTSPDRIQSWS